MINDHLLIVSGLLGKFNSSEPECKLPITILYYTILITHLKTTNPTSFDPRTSAAEEDFAGTRSQQLPVFERS